MHLYLIVQKEAGDIDDALGSISIASYWSVPKACMQGLWPLSAMATQVERDVGEGRKEGGRVGILASR